MSEKIIFSGIQPSGNLHIGNYIGAVSRWVKSQDNGTNIYCIVDMHAITVPQKPAELKEKSLELAALLLAAGIDPEKSILFIQSQNPDHANLGWVLNCMSTMGELSRMTQFKDKSDGKASVSVGLFDYPVLMAADILLYNTTHVPVGEDQKQHVELARDIAGKFNSTFGDTFVLPEPSIATVGKRIMSLTDPSKKMSKSEPNDFSRIGLLDTPEVIKQKLARATTDSSEKFNAEAPGVHNLLEIYSYAKEISLSAAEKEFANARYSDFKSAVADAVITMLTPFQERYKSFREMSTLSEILEKGAANAQSLSKKKLEEVYEKVGFVR
jgi:tryptophanyl-tRNA synthetase